MICIIVDLHVMSKSRINFDESHFSHACGRGGAPVHE